jgi:hypothetical protein
MIEKRDKSTEEPHHNHSYAHSDNSVRNVNIFGKTIENSSHRCCVEMRNGSSHHMDQHLVV